MNFWQVFGCIWKGFWNQNGRKIDAKTMSKTCWNRSWSRTSENMKNDSPSIVFVAFWIPNPQQNDEKTVSGIVFLFHFWRRLYINFILISMDSGGILEAKMEPNSLKRCWKNMKKWSDCCISGPLHIGILIGLHSGISGVSQVWWWRKCSHHRGPPAQKMLMVWRQMSSKTRKKRSSHRPWNKRKSCQQRPSARKFSLAAWLEGLRSCLKTPNTWRK